jgi:hypothetical protein
LIVTVCTVWYPAEAGVKTGVAAGGAIVYAAEAALLGLYLLRNPTASIFSLADTVIGPVYNAEEAVGVVPLVVYRSEAPAVEHFNVTVCGVVYVPPAGEIVGVATCDVARQRSAKGDNEPRNRSADNAKRRRRGSALRGS